MQRSQAASRVNPVTALRARLARMLALQVSTVRILLKTRRLTCRRPSFQTEGRWLGSSVRDSERPHLLPPRPPLAGNRRAPGRLLATHRFLLTRPGMTQNGLRGSVLRASATSA